MKSMATTAISVLDLAKIYQDGSIAAAFARTRELAQLVDKLNYSRFWLAEHHNIESIASAATAVLIGHVAEHTSRIRVGSGGIMLPNHSPLIIAEQFGTLATLYPNRIDLGLGRAPGSDQHTMRALRRETARDPGRDGGRETDFGDLINELQFYFRPAEPGQKLKAIPGAGINIPLYILGSSLYSAVLAARLGLPYAFAGHFAPAEMMRAFSIYRSEFQPNANLKSPYVMVGVPVIAAETDRQAQYLATSIQQTFLGMVRGDRTAPTAPVDDINQLWTPREKAAVDSMLALLVYGSVERVRRDLDVLIQQTGADELIIMSETYDPADRLKSFTLINAAKKHT